MTERQTEALEKLSRGIQESRQEVQQRTMSLAQDYFGDSAESLKQQIDESRATLKGLPDQIPGGREEAFQTLFQELMDNYSAMEECIDKAQKDVADLDTDQIRREGEIEASDAARQQARELDVDLSEVKGTGSEGRIVVDDVRNMAESTQNGATGQLQDIAAQAGSISAPSDGGVTEVEATDAARREAESRGIDLSQVKGTGADGRIIISDVVEMEDPPQGSSDPAGQLKNQSSAAAGQATQQAQQMAGQATDQAGQAAGQAQQAAGQAADQAQQVAGGVADQASGVLGGMTDQVGQAAGQVQETAGGAAQQAQQAAGGAVEGDEDEGPKVTNAARRKAREMGVDLSQVRGTGSGGLITIKDVTGS